MFRNPRIFLSNKRLISIHTKTFLTNEYKCADAWSTRTSSALLNKVNLNDFYNILSQNHISKDIISAIDVDIFVNAVNEPSYLEEIKDLVHKLRLSAETGCTLESTHHATIRNYIEFGNLEDLLQILSDPLNFGIFLDYYTANILLDKLLVSKNYEQAANVAGLVMLQEEYDNAITCALSQYASYMYICNYKLQPKEEVPLQEPKKKKVEEIKIRVKYLRNPYNDDHFDIRDTYTLAGKTLAWLSEKSTENINNNLQIIGWLVYNKKDKLLEVCNNLSKSSTFKIYTEVLNLLNRYMNSGNPEDKPVLEKAYGLLQNAPVADLDLEKALQNHIENAINKSQVADISNQQKMFNSWIKLREQKLEEQIQRLDRAKRIQNIQEKQKELQDEEQKLWFFDNEDQIDLQIEEKDKLQSDEGNKKSLNEKDDDYVPPEIVKKRK